MSNQPTPFQTLSRLVIMLGTLTVGSMAAYRYGPEPDRLAGLINHVVLSVGAAAGSAPAALASGAAMPLEPAPLVDSGDLQPLEAAPAPHFDPAVVQASASLADGPDATLDPLERDRLVAPLLEAGATRADLTAWGRGDRTVYRATASAPVNPDAPALERRFDAVGDTPEQAVARLAAEVREASAY